MPVVRIDMWEGRTLEQKDDLIREVTEAVVKALKVSHQDVVVILSEVSKDHWGVGGQRSSRKK
ncbi:MAG: 2-hydroxymuconate tautomerase family protein [Candidatus Altiarchaeota archaeon]|nr:2-hydroxymuconate tautomerase family protein [Candidatus Altiarchaeota archaeon]